MDDFERRLASSMKAAAEQMPSPARPGRHHRAGLIALAASVVVASVIAGITWLFNPSDSSTSIAGQDEPCATLSYEGQSFVRSGTQQNVGIGPLLGAGETLGCGESEQIQVYEYRKVAGTGVNPIEEPKDDWVVVRDTSDGVVQFLAYEPLTDEPINIEGEWKVTALTGPDGGSLLLEGHTPTLRFLPTNSMTGIEGCSAIAAAFNQSGATDLVFSNIRRITDDRAKNAFCADPDLAGRLGDVRHVSETNGKLQLHAENWMIIAVLERADSSDNTPELESTEWVSYGPRPKIQIIQEQSQTVQNLAEIASVLAETDGNEDHFLGSYVDERGKLIVVVGTDQGKTIAGNRFAGRDEVEVRRANATINSATEIGLELSDRSPTLKLRTWGPEPQTLGLFMEIARPFTEADQRMIETYAEENRVHIRIIVGAFQGGSLDTMKANGLPVG